MNNPLSGPFVSVRIPKRPFIMDKNPKPRQTKLVDVEKAMALPGNQNSRVIGLC